MNIEKLKTAWYPLFVSQKLTTTPQSVELLGQKLVLARLNEVVVCFDDCCPHRHFPLSEGNIVAGKLVCGYHGWQFDTTGAVCKLSGGMCDNNSVNASVKKFPCVEQDDWIWVNLTDDIAFEPFADFATPDGFESINAQKSMTGDLIHAIENLLDPTHTAYIHRGILRNTGTQAMKITQIHDNHSFSTHYTLVQQQNGLINRLFDRGITVNHAKFTFPSLTCIDYFTPTSHEYRVSVFFIPQNKGKLKLSIRIHLPKDNLPLQLKSLILQPFLELILYQDKIAVAKQYRNQRFPKQDFVSTNNDLVIDHLLYLLANAPEGVDKSGIMTLE